MSRELRLRVRDAAVVIAAFGLAGALAGIGWHWWWSPSTGVVMEGRLLLDGAALRADFTGTASYVVIAASVGLLLGLAAAVVAERDEITTLAAIVVGSLLAGWLMVLVGTTLGPSDALADAAPPDGTEVLLPLTVHGSAVMAFPLGALTGALVVFLGMQRRRGDSHNRVNPGLTGHREG